MNKLKLSAVLLVFCVLQSCTNEQHPISFYHWKTGFAPVENERVFLEESENTKVYVRAFDLLWNARTQQEEQVSFMKVKQDSLKFIDEVALVVYIENHLIRNISERKLLFLAARTAQLLRRSRGQFEANNSNIKLYELQIDCDWTLKSRDKYFKFLELMDQEARRVGFTKLTTTIRLHQVKFMEKTGIPPVDEGVLMFYNMGDVEDPLERNSILNLETAKQYTSRLKEYPLPLDVALPLFSWGVQYRDGRAVQIINSLNKEDVESCGCCTKIDDNRYEVKTPMYLNNRYLYVGDQVRIEAVEKDQLEEAAELLSDEMPTEDYRLIFYHLDYKLLKDYSYEELKALAEI
jgi:hypothetical protein